jgi:glycosyltransferase involved in cell wall biosynthesis
MQKVLIVVPAYNEAHRITSSLNTLVSFLESPSFPFEYRLVVVNNGSADRTFELSEHFSQSHPQVSAMNLSAKGKGGAVKAAWDTASENILTFMDADLSTDLGYFPDLVRSVADDEADLVVGNRLGETSILISDKRMRKFVSRAYNVLSRALLGTDIIDHQCGFKAMTRAAYERLRPELRDFGFFFDTELIAYARASGLRIKELAVRWVDAPVSKVPLVPASAGMLASLLMLAFRLRIQAPSFRQNRAG